MLRSDLESIEDPKQFDAIELLVLVLSFLSQFCPVFQFRRIYHRLNGELWVKSESASRK